jgi:hypothetical protein
MATDVIANNTWQIVQALAANPQALENPVTRALIFDYAEKVGINPSKLESMDINQMVGQQQGGRMPQISPMSQEIGQGEGKEVAVGKTER